ncbi:hypothetical protein PHET_03748 [Paragonimus heterotremus]|uniref:Uncharacterized protein n=1 Tax=Paragonimus heterotremus TaxID=100268 RepID=A0A8J4SNK9_9TREM|nr:hypothetical protein PHET_03748 [Paragonimus heterotremus]
MLTISSTYLKVCMFLELNHVLVINSSQHVNIRGYFDMIINRRHVATEDIQAEISARNCYDHFRILTTSHYQIPEENTSFA